MFFITCGSKFTYSQVPQTSGFCFRPDPWHLGHTARLSWLPPPRTSPVPWQWSQICLRITLRSLSQRFPARLRGRLSRSMVSLHSGSLRHSLQSPKAAYSMWCFLQVGIRVFSLNPAPPARRNRLCSAPECSPGIAKGYHRAGLALAVPRCNRSGTGSRTRTPDPLPVQWLGLALLGRWVSGSFA